VFAYYVFLFVPESECTCLAYVRAVFMWYHVIYLDNSLFFIRMPEGYHEHQEGHLLFITFLSFSRADRFNLRMLLIVCLQTQHVTFNKVTPHYTITSLEIKIVMHQRLCRRS